MKLSTVAVLLSLAVPRSLVASDFATTVMDATFKVFNPASTSTCFVVRDSGSDSEETTWLVTTAHTLERMKGDTAIIVLRRLKKDGSYERVDHRAAIRKDGKALWTRHKKHDVAVLKLSGDLPVDVAALPADRLADEARLADSKANVCGSLFVFTYPERFEANSAGFPIARQGIFASPPQLPSGPYPTFLADFTTFAGDSGGPVFVSTADGSPLVVGLVQGQQHHDEKIESVYESRRIKHPFRLGIVLHARYILETLKQASSSGE